MRIEQLTLAKYGKFTDREVVLPPAKRDFHLVIGPNEAGKSTLRKAIHELFYGIATRTTLDFIHPKNEMRLAATVQHAGQTLAFQRVKALRQTLRDMKDAVLPDEALVPFVGATDSAFFENMFSLDHARLVSGGKDILDASDNVGQVLFQASAGIASLGKVVEELQAQADALWAPRKAGDRLYYKAADQLDAAAATLKSVAVRTKDWVEAHGRVAELNAQMATEKQRHKELEQKRATLERVRRIAPVLGDLRESEKALSELREVIDLPVESLKTVEAAEGDLAAAREVLKVRTATVEGLQEELKLIQLDDVILPLQADITALEELRVKYSPYARDLERRGIEVAQAWEQAQAAMSQLGWTEADEQSVRKRMPPLDKRKAVDRLIKAYGRLAESARTLRRSAQAKALEVESLKKQLVEHPETVLPVALIQARNNALQLGEVDSTRDRHEIAVVSASKTTASAFEKLGIWSRDPAALGSMRVPEIALVEQKIQEKQTLQVEKRQMEARLREQMIKVEKARLAVKQYQDMHHPVTAEDVLVARRVRDEAWAEVKSSAKSVTDGASAVEEGIRHSDELADARATKAEQEAEFQSRRNQLAQDELEQQWLTKQVAAIESKLDALTESWIGIAAAANLQDMALETVAGWMAHRDAALAAEDAEGRAKANAAQFEARVKTLADALSAALDAAGADEVQGSELSALLLQAQALTNDAEAARGRRETLNSQLTAAQTTLVSQEQEAKAAEEDLAKWQSAWEESLKSVGLPANSDLSAGESALQLIEDIEKQIDSMRETRVKRIEAMQADLTAFERDVARVVSQIDPQLAGQPASSSVPVLMHRLTAALAAKKDHERLAQELAGANKLLHGANETITDTTARLGPLLGRVGTDSMDVLREAIYKSDRHRQLSADVERLRKQLRDSSDGLKREVLEPEIDASDLAQVSAESATLNQQLGSSQDAQRQLAANLATASAALEKVAGGDAAARAEAERQSALASMADAAERFVQVATASRLLRWAIDQYREKKQGPLLARAGAIFSGLTLGSFQKLHVDYDQSTPALEGMRANGGLVGISGMSDGSRDQLFLALRLAALELHLQNAHAMPFIADDLFINFDDERSEAGLRALADLSEKTQVVFLSHHDHLASRVKKVFGTEVNIVAL